MLRDIYWPTSRTTRRAFLRASGLGLGALSFPAPRFEALAVTENAEQPTEFQIACMTLAYSRFPLQRALRGIKAAGYDYVAWGTRHVEAGGERVPVMPTDAPPPRARELGRRCRDLGLTPLMIFSTVYPEAPDGLKVLSQRIRQAAAAGIGQVLTFGHTKGGNRKVWIERFKRLGPMARDHGVMIVVKQHGGSTGQPEET